MFQSHLDFDLEKSREINFVTNFKFKANTFLKILDIKNA